MKNKTSDKSEMSRTQEVLTNFVIFVIVMFFSENTFRSQFHWKSSLGFWGRRVGSTSPSGENRVDGLLPASNFQQTESTNSSEIANSV